MSAGEHEAGLCEVDLEDAKDELERILADPRFHATARAKRMLRYIAERCFEGERAGVKAYAIAIDVLNRPERFDTNADPIVRIEMSRLRNALSNYYEAYGDDIDVTVHLPVGRYVALFTRRASVAETDVAAPSSTSDYIETAAEDGINGAAATTRPMRYRLVAAGGAVCGLAIAGCATAVFGLSTSSHTEKPSISISITSADDAHADEAEDTGRYLITALSQFRTLDMSVAASGSGMTSQPAYAIQLKYYADDEDRSVWWQVADGQKGGIIKSGVERVALNGRSLVSVRDELVSTLSKHFGSTRGVINNLEAHRDASGHSLGNGCVLRGEIALDEGGRISIAAAEPCLTKTLVREPNSADAMAVLSRVMVAKTGGDPETTDFAYAMTLANRAVSVDPGSDRAYVALMMAHFYAGRTEAAISSGNQALALNPNNPEVLAKLAGVLFSSGYQTAAVTLATEASQHIEVVPRDARIVLALDAYDRSDWADASLASEQINCGDFVVRAIRAASLGQMGSPDATRSLAYLKKMLPDYKNSMRIWMSRRKYPEKVMAGLEQGLAKAELVSDRLASIAH